MSMPPRPTSKFTFDQYLAIEREADERHVYLNGEIFAMAGESDRHGEITMNLAGLVHQQLQGKPCRGRTKDTKVRSGIGLLSGHSTQGMFSYPDIVVICGEREFHDDHKDVIVNPTAIMEVLSASTEAFDRGEKFLRYRTWNPTLTDYVLVSQDKPHVEHFVKQADGTWSFNCYTDLDAIVTIASIGCTFKLAEIYQGVDFGFPTNEE